MSLTKEDLEQVLEKKLNEKLKPIIDSISDTNTKLEHTNARLDSVESNLSNKLEIVARDLAEIRYDMGYGNLKVIKSKDDQEEM